MIIDVLTHVPFEDAANVENWAAQRNRQIRYCHLHKNMPLPNPDNVKFLAIMGGPMNVYDTHLFPWLDDEKKLIEKLIKKSTPVLGLCLGGQLIADVLGAKVIKNKYREIGWHTVNKTPQAQNSLLSTLPEEFITFQWHSDTFDIPAGATHLAFNNACANQSFQYSKNVLALQFHIEYTKHSIDILIENCRNEIDDTRYVQTQKHIYRQMHYLEQSNKMLFSMMDNFALQIT